MIITVVGARPQFIKAAVVSRALANEGIPEFLVHTGQHYDERMSAVFWQELGLPGVGANLAVGSAHHGAQTGQMMERLEALVLGKRSEFKGMLVYGDTNSTLAGVLVAAKLRLPVFHVEAGLRSFDRSMPEEVNRVVTDHLSELLFCPSEHARSQLAAEGIARGVHVVGDVMLDATEAFRNAARSLPEGAVHWGRTGRRRVLLTVHRPANTDEKERLRSLTAALGDLPIEVLWPAHPRIRSQVSELSLAPNIHVREPLSYLEVLRALELCDVVVTDSGGLQKEAYWFRRPCVTLRAATEWVETVEQGWNTLVGDDMIALRRAVMSDARTAWCMLYGDGNAARRIAEHIGHHAP